MKTGKRKKKEREGKVVSLEAVRKARESAQELPQDVDKRVAQILRNHEDALVRLVEELASTNKDVLELKKAHRALLRTLREHLN